MDRLTELEMLRNPEFYRKTKFRTGLWRARVVRNDDDQRRGRLQVRILQLHPSSAPTGIKTDAPSKETATLVGAPDQGVDDRLLPWAEPAFPFGGAAPTDGRTSVLPKTQGFVMLPAVGSTVWVGFELGFVGRPVWLGAWLGSNELPSEFTDPANIRLIKTPAGHLLLFDDTENGQKILLAEATDLDADPRIRFIEIDRANERVTIQNGLPGSGVNETKVILDKDKILLQQGDPAANGTKIEIDGTTPGAEKVTIQAGPTTDAILERQKVTIRSGDNTIVLDVASGDVSVNATGNVILGTGASLGVMLDTMISLFNSHTHTETGGVTSVPNQLLVAGTHSSSTVLAKL